MNTSGAPTKRSSPVVLFITRKYPPSIGGAQRSSYKLLQHLRQQAPVQAITWGGTQWFLPFFLAWSLLRALWLSRRHRFTLIYVADIVLAPVGIILRQLLGIPVVVTLRGRDVSIPHPIYRRCLSYALQRMDALVAVSECIQDRAIARGAPRERCSVISNGVDVEDFSSLDRPTARRMLEEWLGRSLRGRFLLLSVGRLVPKKGFTFFLGEVLPLILEQHREIIYLLIGEGPLRPRLEKMIQRQGLHPWVALTGGVPMESELLRAAYAGADLFVMPNVPVANDTEGFGNVILEANAAGLPVVASAVDGPREIVQLAVNGYPVPAGDAPAMAQAILWLLQDEATRSTIAARSRSYVQERYAWDKISAVYCHFFHCLVTEKEQEK